MYESYWQLKQGPFDHETDAGFFHRSDTHQAALLKLRYLVENHKGIGVLAGAGGTGKTYITQILAEQLGATHGPFVHLVFPQMSASELLAYLAVELGADASRVGGELGLDRTLRELEQRLVALGEAHRSPVLIVDEAHLIDDLQVFQSLRLLMNFAQQKHVPLTLILCGQPELLCTVRRIGQLEERLAVNCVLRPLTEDETSGYVTHRLQAAGCRRRIFQADALQALFELSAGIPRRINRICDLALLVGYADELRTLSASHIEAVCEELTTAVAD